VSVAPDIDQPGPSRIVGALPPCGAGKKCSAIFVPSNEVTPSSRAKAAGAPTSVASTATSVATVRRMTRNRNPVRWCARRSYVAPTPR
jgi:hypothetical protein